MGQGKLAGRTALITGGGEGIGRGMARRMAAEGAQVVIADFQTDLGERTAQALRDDFGTESLAVATDVRGDSTGGSAGTCFKCTTNADCLESSKHNGPTCEVATGKCIDTDTDGDGLNDSIELNLGTDPTKVDSDGDGISDNIEARPSGGGNPAKIDTTGDGVIDALDDDSDGDTLPDSQEGTIDTDGDGACF